MLRAQAIQGEYGSALHAIDRVADFADVNEQVSAHH
jgi:hypothetical protein